ncbi:MAG: dienelactone hydrolase family protein [Acidimicrobiales bacterium]|nr:dienelactone hydrolase family protein [Acidimicrobiales bacterium]
MTALANYERTTFTHGGKTRDVFRRGTGPAVIVIAEMPGITPKVIEFADRVVDLGCTAVMPHLFGVPGKYVAAEDGVSIAGTAYFISSYIPVCVSREFVAFATGKSSPVVDWLRALASHEHEACGGPGVGAIGMCFTGGFALAMATNPSVLAPVLSQPSTPIGFTRKARYGIDISRSELEQVKTRCREEDLRVLGMCFKSDRLVPAERFQYLRDELGDAFVGIELEDSDANPAAAIPPHSVVTEHLLDEPGSGSRDALDQVLDLFRTKLLTPD